jgi:hypothetical protein
VKLDAMKKAASDLVSSMLATDELKTRVRVAVVPFSDGVRLPALPKLAAAGVAPAVQTFSESYQSCSWGQNCQTKWNYYYYHPTDCVVERIDSKTPAQGSKKYTDDAPGPGLYVTTLMRLGKSATDSTPAESGCSMGASSVVMPLSNNKDAILTTISGLSAKGGTAGQVGTAWTWYTLSPNWKDVWAGSSDDPASAASDKTLRKIAILMTDGDYNTQFAKGGYYPGSWAYSSSQAGNNVISGTSSAQAQELCTGMKKDIEVYTIGYEVSSAAETFLKTCATDASHAFKADSAAELQAVFKGIGQRVMALYLSQ